MAPAEERAAWATELSPGENLNWTGRPGSVRRLVVHSVPQTLVGLAFVAFTLVWMVMVVQGGHNNWDRGQFVPPFAPHNLLIATLAGLWMIPPGIFVLIGPLRTWRRLKTTCYALTDRRAIVGERRLFGRLHCRSYAPAALRLMRLEEKPDDSGDLIFECISTWDGRARPVGFLAIDRAREVEALVRKTLLSGARPDIDSPGRAAAHPDLAIAVSQTYRIALAVRLFQFVALAAGLLAGFCLLGNLVLALFVLVFRPTLLFALVPQIEPFGVLGVAGSLAAGMGSLLACGIVVWGFFHIALAIPSEIAIDERGAIGFRSRLRTVTVQAGDILSIRTGGWFDPNRFQAVVRHKGGKLMLINQFPGFRDFLVTVRELNPAVEIKGF